MDKEVNVVIEGILNVDKYLCKKSFGIIMKHDSKCISHFILEGDYVFASGEIIMLHNGKRFNVLYSKIDIDLLNSDYLKKL